MRVKFKGLAMVLFIFSRSAIWFGCSCQIFSALLSLVSRFWLGDYYFEHL